MTKDEVKAVLERIPTWPEDRQQELAAVALEIEAELAGAEYEATLDELDAIEEGLAGGKPRARRKSKQPSRCSGRDEGRIFEASRPPIFDTSPPNTLAPVSGLTCGRVRVEHRQLSVVNGSRASRDFRLVLFSPGRPAKNFSKNF